MIGKEAHVLQSQIAEEIPLEGKTCASIHICITGGQEHGNLFEPLRRLGIEGCIEAVNDAFELAADVVIVDGRGQHQHVRLPKAGVDLLHIVLLRAGPLPFPVAEFTGQAAADIHAADRKGLHAVPGFFRRLPENGDHFRRVPLGAGAAVQHKNVHLLASIQSVIVTSPCPRSAVMSAAL